MSKPNQFPKTVAEAMEQRDCEVRLCIGCTILARRFCGAKILYHVIYVARATAADNKTIYYGFSERLAVRALLSGERIKGKK